MRVGGNGRRQRQWEKRTVEIGGGPYGVGQISRVCTMLLGLLWPRTEALSQWFALRGLHHPSPVRLRQYKYAAFGNAQCEYHRPRLLQQIQYNPDELDTSRCGSSSARPPPLPPPHVDAPHRLSTKRASSWQQPGVGGMATWYPAPATPQTRWLTARHGGIRHGCDPEGGPRARCRTPASP